MIILKISILFCLIFSGASAQQEGDEFYETFINETDGQLVKQLVNLTEGYIPRRVYNKTEERILGGGDANPGEYPFFVFIRLLPHNNLQASYCGGTVLSLRWVLTAAHCTVNRPASKIWVHSTFLNSKLLSYQQRLPAIKKVEHPAYQHLFADLCLLQVREPGFFEGNTLKPVKLPRGSDDNVAPRTKCTVVGFGQTVIDTKKDPWPTFNQKRLREAQLSIFTDQVFLMFFFMPNFL